MKRKKKSIKTKLKEKLWELCKEYIKLRDQNICQKCNEYVEKTNCHTSHVIPKSHGNVLRFDPLNLKIFCYHHHINWWHKNPVEAGEWFKDKFPERYDYLMERKETLVKFTESDYQDMINDYEEKITDLKVGNDMRKELS